MLTRPDALDKAALLLQILGNFIGVKDDPGVEVGKGNNQEEIQRRINECLPRTAGKGAWVWRLKPRDQGVGGILQVWIARGLHDLADELRQAKEGDGKDDRDDASGDQLDRQDALDAAVAGIAVNALGIIDGDDTLGFVDFHQEVENDERGDSHDHH